MPRRLRGRATPDPELFTRIDRAIMHMRRMIAKPPELSMPMPSLNRSVEVAKVHACVAVAEAGDERAVSVKDVAAILGLEHSTTSRLLGEAESEGLLVRSPDPDDRRRTTVSLTEQGHLVVQDADTMRNWAMGQMFSEWSEKDLKTLATLLERMSATMSQRMPDVLCAARERFPEPTQTA